MLKIAMLFSVRRHYLPKGLLFFVSSLLSATSVCVAQSENLSAPTIIDLSKGQVIWVSQSANAEDFASELSGLYLTLYNTGRLTVTTGVHSGASSIEGVARERQLLIGPIFPLGLESLLCDLNTSICARDRTGQSAKTDRSQTATAVDPLSSTVQGVPTSPALEWTATPDTALTLPDSRLERISKWTRLYKKAEDTLESLVINKYAGCDTFDDQCKGRILAYNRGFDATVFAPTWSGEISIPVIGARASINVGVVSQSAPGEINNNQINGTVLKHKVAPSWDVDPDIGNLVRNPTINEKAFGEEIGKSLQSVVRGKLFSIEDQEEGAHALIPKDFATEHDHVLAETTFPYNKLDEYPGNLQAGNVGVFDGWVDQSHCAFLPGKVKIEILNFSNYNDAAKEKKCDVEEKADDEKDHGTHVVGIIASRSPDDSEYGINPYARVFAREIDLLDLNSSDLEKAQSAAKDLGKEIVDMRLNHNVDVINMSWGYLKITSGEDPIERAIEDQSWSVLFVTAAGNEGDDKTHICDIRPACFDLPNVISVAALGDNPVDLLKIKGKPSTNFGTHVHIAAPGENVLSTISYGRYGRMSGTSEAAPMVTAVASILMVEESRLKPIEVKNRLIYCSDMAPQLDGKLFGGVLNATCTIDAKSDQLSLLGDPQKLVRHGRLSLGGPNIQVKNTVTGKKLEIPIDSVRGIQANPVTGTSTIFYNDYPEKKDSILLKEEDVKFVPDGAEVVFVPSDGTGSENIKLNQIRKYASAAQ